MSIKELPGATSRLLSSAQVLRTPASLVKELVDNALDAKATSVDIVISANTIDKIEVRDNGHGITSEDLKVIGKRGYTSKVCTFDEVKSLGGRSLGFRGEALASAVELGNVSITTRVEGEAVATMAKLDAHGGISSQALISHPIGTTVCCTKLFSRLPIRKQNALKDAKKTILRIKEMLQSYALARLTIRLTLKVIQAENNNWSFAPRSNESIREILSHVIGRETSLQCVQMIGTLPISSHSDSPWRDLDVSTLVSADVYKCPNVPSQSGFIIQALLPKPDADLTKIHGAQYISIDSRPVSCARGTPKKITSIYKSIISAMSLGDISKKVKSPFISLNIFCPAGSYDPNIEPAKDDVIFEDDSILLSLLEDWFSSVYGDRILTAITSYKASREDKALEMTEAKNPLGFLSVSANSPRRVEPGTEVLRAPNMIDDGTLQVSAACGITNQMDLAAGIEVPDALSSIDQMRSGLDMSEDYSNEMEVDKAEQKCPSHEEIAKDTEHKNSSHVSCPLNPWVIAKLNTSTMKSRTRESTLTDSVDKLINNVFPKPKSSSKSYLSQDYHDMGPIKRSIYENVDSIEQQPSSIKSGLRQRNGISHDNSIEISNVRISLPVNSKDRRTSEVMGNDDMGTGVSISAIQPLPYKGAHVAATIPQIVDGLLVPQSKNSRLAVQPITEIMPRGLPSHHPQLTPNLDMIFDETAQNLKDRNEHTLEIHEALDFERRKEAATRKLRQQLRQSRLIDEVSSSQGNVRTASSPDKNLYGAATAALELSQIQSTIKKIEDKTPKQSCLPDDDPRAYLMRRQRLPAAYPENQPVGHKLRRVKTVLLPLENIPKRAELYNLCRLVLTNTGVVRGASLKLACHDQYVKSGKQAKGLLMSEVDIQKIEVKLDTLIRRWVQVTTSDEADIVFDLTELRGRSVADV